MKIEKLCLYNFRIYNGKKEFNFKEKKLVVFLGANGAGKSAIYDAIEWLITGDISRYSDSKENNFNFIVNNSNFNSGCYETYVEITFDNGVVIKRIIEKKEGTNTRELRRIIINDGTPLTWMKGTNEIYKKITEDNTLEGLDRFIKTFKSSTILSQDELSSFVLSDKPEERLKLFMDILSLEGFGSDFKKDINSSKKKNKDEVEKNTSEKNLLQLNKETLVGKLKQKETELKYEQNIEEVKNIYKKDELINIVNKLLSENKLFTGKELIINDIDIKSINILSKLIKDLTQKKEILEEDLHFINSYIRERMLTIEDLKSECTNLSKNIIEENVSRCNLDINIKDLYKEKSKIEKIVNRIENYKMEEESLKNIKEKIFNLENECSILQKKLEEDGFKSIEEFKVKKAEALEKEKLFNNILECKKIENIITELKNDSNAKEKLIEASRKNIEETLLKIQDVENELKVLYENSNNKQSEIDKITYTIQEEIIKEKQNICIVCGNDFSTSDKMETAIKVLRKARQLEKNAYNKRVLELENLKKEYSLFLENINKVLKDLTNSFNIAKNNILSYQQIYNSIAYNIKDKDMNKSNIEDELNNIKNKIIKFSSLELIVKKIEDIKDNLGIIIIQKKYSENHIEDLFELISNGYDELISEEKFKASNDIIKLSKSNAINLNNILVKIKINLENNINEKKEELESSKLKISTYEKKLQETKNKILIHDNRQRKSNEILEIYNAENLEQFIVNSDNYMLDNEKIINQLKEKINLINSYISNTKVSVLTKDIDEINKKIKSLDNHLDELENINKRLKNKQSMLDELSDKLPNIMSDLLSEFLKISNKEINKNFIQVSPYINKKYINIVSRDGGLYILLTESEEYDDLVSIDKKSFEKQVNASMTLSSAQSNILALSVFLTSNKINVINNFEVVGLDDPFQNMDDINIYSLIDILCDLMKSKQVLVSTHDSSFVNLLVSKSGLRADQIEIVEYITYDESGVYILGEELDI